MDKRDFVRACRDGGKLIDAALRQLMKDYGGALRREAWLALRDDDQAADLLQDTLIKVWRKCSSYRAESELFPWLKQVLRRGAIDRLRSARPEVPMQGPNGQPTADVEAALQAMSNRPPNPPEAAALAQQSEAVFRRCMARLAADHPLAAEVIRWMVEDDLGPAEIAGLLQRSPGATREFLSQCRKKARVYLADWYALNGCFEAEVRS